MTTEIVSVPLNAEARLELASMAYGRWCKAFDALKATKAQTWESVGKFCPRAEWPLYQKGMVEGAEAELAKAARLRDAICPFSPIMEQMGS